MKTKFKLKHLTGIYILLGLVIAFVPENTTFPFRLTSEEMMDEIQGGSEFIHPDELADMIINKDPSFQLIDIRTPDEFQKFCLPGALNIPQSKILSDNWADVLDQDIKMNILYSNGNTRAHESWMIIRQLGFENNYILQGGLNYWAETILNPQKPSDSSPNDELAKYDFRKGASQYFGNTPAAAETGNKVSAPERQIKRKKKKKAPEGGC